MEIIDTGSVLDNVLPLDPFAGRPGWASRIPGLGGADVPSDPGYIFCTLSVRPALGPATITIFFENLAASGGSLVVEVTGVSSFPGAEMSRIATFAVPLIDIIKAGGILEIPFVSSPNTLYAVYGALNEESDVSADSIRAQLDHAENLSYPSKPWRWKATSDETKSKQDGFGGSSLTSLERPSFEKPVSQIATPSQLLSSEFKRCLALLQLGLTDDVILSFGPAFVLKAIEELGPQTGHLGGVGFGKAGSDLSSYFASKKIETLVVQNMTPDENYDQGQMLADLHKPLLCSKDDFFDHVHLTVHSLPRYPSSLTSWFDFAWSVGLNRELNEDEFEQFIPSSLNCLKPGGLAIHVFDFSPGRSGGDRTIDRPRLERIALRCLAQHDNVAIIKFRPNELMVPLRPPYPFGLVLRKGNR